MNNVNASHFTMDSFGGAVVPANDFLLPGSYLRKLLAGNNGKDEEATVPPGKKEP